MLSRLMFAIVNRAARKGLVESAPAEDASAEAAGPEPKHAKKERARRTGVRGETYAYWYLRRHGYIVVARNYMRSGVKGEIDMVGYDGPVLAFVEVKTRAAAEPRRYRIVARATATRAAGNRRSRVTGGKFCRSFARIRLRADG